MNIKQFPNPKLNLPLELRGAKEDATTKCLHAVEVYLSSVRNYIYTDVKVDYETSDPSRLHTWIQITVSESVLRSLYIRNAFVENINSRNFVALFLPLKAWFEIVGFLASILELLEKKLSEKELDERLKPFVLGNRGKGTLRVGTTEVINVTTMIEKADQYMIKMEKEVGFPKKKVGSFFTDFYDLASNPSHPTWDAHQMVGSIDDDSGTWRGKQPDEVKRAISEEFMSYGGLLLAPLTVVNICKKIYVIENEHFVKLGSKKYFD